MGRSLRRGIFFALLCAFAAPAPAADPLLMLLFGMARDMLLSHIERSASAPAEASPAEPPRFYPGTSVEPEILRRLIDDCFLYLSGEQRREIFEALNEEILKPKNAAVRAAMIEYFAHRALAVRAAQVRLAQMSRREKELLADNFRREVASLPEEEQARFGEVLRKGLLPVPDDLNQLLLAALAR